MEDCTQSLMKKQVGDQINSRTNPDIVSLLRDIIRFNQLCDFGIAFDSLGWPRKGGYGYTLGYLNTLKARRTWLTRNLAA